MEMNIMSTFNPHKKTVFITGSGRGIGRAAALYFAGIAPQKWNIVINSCHHPDQLQKTCEDIRALGAECLALTGDVGDFELTQTMFDQIQATFGQVDVLVNNAGMAHLGLLSDMTQEQWDTLLRTNLGSVFNCCHHAIPAMVRQKSGKIINISSVWGNVGASCEAAYSASKGGVNALTRALARELAPSNIQVNAIACGAIDTEMNHFLHREDLIGLMEDIPAGRLGKAEEVADLAYHLGYKESYLTGQIIGLDGGWI